MIQLSFIVADMPYDVIFDDDTVDYRNMLPSHGRFLRPESCPEPVAMTLRVGVGRVTDDFDGLERVGHFPTGDSSYDVYRLPEGGYKIRIVDLNDIPVGIFCTSARFDDCSATLIGSFEQQRFGLQNTIMVCYAFCGAYHNILMMHASVIKLGNYGYLFQGKSGTGKSTHSRLWLENIADTELLNDDNPAVRLMPDGTVRVYGTPWSGKTPCYKQQWAEVGAFLRLHQAPQNEISRMNPLESFASILSSCSTMIWDEPSYDGICNTITGICKVVSSYDMNCLPNPEAAQMSHAAISR